MRCVLVLLLLAGGAGLGGCAGGLPPVANEGDLSRAQQTFPGQPIALADLQHGRDLLIKKCSSCHATPMPGEQKVADWPAAVDNMALRANLEHGQQAAIVRYLVTVASR